MRYLSFLLAASLLIAGTTLFCSSLIAASPSIRERGSKPVATIFTAPSAFPTSAFPAGYYQEPSGFDHEPRPKITDPPRQTIYPDSLDYPLSLPTGAPSTEAYFPRPSDGVNAPGSGSVEDTISKIKSIISGSDSNCTKCMDALKVAQRLVQAKPHLGPPAMVALCKKFSFVSTKSGLTSEEACERTYAPSTLGAQMTQILSWANFTQGSVDAQAICSRSFTYCDLPAATHLSDDYFKEWFKGKVDPPAKGPPAKPGKALKGGRQLRVLHLSDIHVDPRFLVGAEANCTSGQCCRQDSFNSLKTSQYAPVGTLLNSSYLVEKANYWGSYLCDSPWSLVVSALRSVTPLNGGRDVDMTLFTGDIATHDATYHYSHDLITQAEQSVFDTMKYFLGKGPVFPALGNHDSSPSDAAVSNSLPGGSEVLAWNYDYFSTLLLQKGWLADQTVKEIRRHYGGYSTSPRQGLRIITINTDFWYTGNAYTNIDYANPDPSGILRFLTDELQRAEDSNEVVWIVGHVYTGWDGSNPLDNPTNLMQRVLQRYSKTIRHLFFGHSHEDFFNVFYPRNGTDTNASSAYAHSFIGPSITPGSRVNPSYGIYTIDPETYEVFDHEVFYTQLSTFKTLQEANHGPIWRRLYSAREVYSNFSASHTSGRYDGLVPLTAKGLYPETAPLNSTFWASLTDEMLLRPELVQQFTVYQGRNSSYSPNCTSQACVEAKVCYLRSGSSLQGKRCPRGFSSVQGE